MTHLETRKSLIFSDTSNESEECVYETYRGRGGLGGGIVNYIVREGGMFSVWFINSVDVIRGRE